VTTIIMTIYDNLWQIYDKLWQFIYQIMTTAVSSFFEFHTQDPLHFIWTAIQIVQVKSKDTMCLHATKNLYVIWENF